MEPQNVKKQDGYQEFNRLQATTPLRKYPWKTIAQNAAGIGAAHALGYWTAGALSHAALSGPAGKYLLKMPAKQRQALIAGAVGMAGTAGVAAAGLSSMAGQVRIAEELARREATRKAQEKAASIDDVVHIYGLAMEDMG